jgi:IMP dehydrogenase/GMP reductase
MSKRTCLWSAGIAILAMSAWVILAGQGSAGQANALKDSVLKIAAAIKMGDTAGAEMQATALAKKIEDLGDLMDLFKKRDKGGIGVGSKAGVVVPDGIETKLISMEKNALSAAALKTEGGPLEEMGYVIAAMAKIAKLKPAAKAKGKDWNGWCDEVAASGVKLSAAAKSQGAADLKAIAKKINASCNACHSAYRI